MESLQVNTPDGISWYVERFTPADDITSPQNTSPIVLIPSGEGDCGNLHKLGTLLASSGYHAISFDNPGFSRTTAPKDAYSPVTPQLIARQIITLLDELHIEKAAFFGNSSGGGAVLAIAALYPEHVVSAIVHEVPLARFPPLDEPKSKSDEEVTAWCEYFFANFFIEQAENDGRSKWDALGPEYHARLKRNYVTWMRNVVNIYEEPSGELATVENLTRRPIFWTVGGMSDRNAWSKDFEVAEKARIEVRTDVLNCLHFPYVSIPEKLSDWIVECVEKASK